MQIQLTVASIVAGLFLCVAGPAATAQPPASFAVEDPLATTCTKLAFKGAKVVVRNETGSKRRVRLAPREFSRGNGKAIGVKKVCGGLIVTPPQLTLPGGASRKLKLRATAARAGNFTGSLALISRKGRISRRAVSISAKPAKAKGLEAVPLIESQSVNLEGSEQGPIWIPVEAAQSSLPSKPEAVGALTGPDGPVSLLYTGNSESLGSAQSAVEVELARDDLEPGSYAGAVDLTPDPEAGKVTIEAKLTACWPMAAAAILIGILLGVALQWFTGLVQPRYRLTSRVGALSERRREALTKLHEKAGARTWKEFDVLNLKTIQDALVASIKKRAKLYRTQIDKPVLDDLEKQIGEVEAQIDLLTELPAHAEDLEAVLGFLPSVPGAKLPSRKGSDANQPKPSMETRARAALKGSAVAAKDLKVLLEGIDARAKQVRILQDLESRLQDLWEARRSLKSVNDPRLATLDIELDAIRHLLWRAASAEDLDSGTKGIQKAASAIAELWGELSLSSPEPLPAKVSTHANINVAMIASAVDPTDATALPIGEEARLVEALEVPASTPSSEAQSPPPSMPSQPPTPPLTAESADRRAQSGWLIQLAIVIVTAAAVLATGLGALYVGKTWGSWPWDYVAAVVWGLGLQATVLGLTSSIDGLGVLRQLHRG